MIKTHVLGFPRMGEHRELKFALEAFWKGQSTEAQLQDTARNLRRRHWLAQRESGLDWVSVGDFSLYDLMADHIQLLGCEPERFGFTPEEPALERYFRMVRGQVDRPRGFALEMTKWFDTNYHYMVPEFDAHTRFSPHPQRLLAQVKEAQDLSLPVKLQLIGPLTFLFLGKWKGPAEATDSGPQLALLDDLLAVYVNVLQQAQAAGVHWVQIDEPVLCLDLPSDWLAVLESTYTRLKSAGCKILLATYFGSTQGQTSQLCKLPVDGLHVDAVRAPEDVSLILDWLPNYKVLSLGLVDGRNIWKTDLDKAIHLAHTAFASGKGEVWLTASCSLLHVPYSFEHDEVVNPEVKPWLAGACEKLLELQRIKATVKHDLQGLSYPSELGVALVSQRRVLKERASSPLLNHEAVKARLRQLQPEHSQRQHGFKHRQALQKARYALPLYPTTTIGSFPQTPAIRSARAAFKRGELSVADYQAQMQAEIREVIEFQEQIGLDVLVHGEAERNDMVEYFGEQLQGYTFSANGWVQSYGSRCVKPPILFGDVHRPQAMTVSTACYAQSLTNKPVKGMLTGPVTMLQWSFVRDDQDRATTALQIALAIRDEVCDLEAAGIGIIQIDEPAYREGLPLRKSQRAAYLGWASEAFRTSASGVQDSTQIHTHMCYSEFNDILPAIASMDADVITIETSRSDMELLHGFGDFKYPNEIGPGVYDIHSPRVPRMQDMLRLIKKAGEFIPAEHLWINPDCGLKTRDWPETEAALKLMVEAAKQVRQA